MSTNGTNKQLLLARQRILDEIFELLYTLCNYYAPPTIEESLRKRVRLHDLTCRLEEEFGTSFQDVVEETNISIQVQYGDEIATVGFFYGDDEEAAEEYAKTLTGPYSVAANGRLSRGNRFSKEGVSSILVSLKEALSTLCCCLCGANMASTLPSDITIIIPSYGDPGDGSSFSDRAVACPCCTPGTMANVGFYCHTSCLRDKLHGSFTLDLTTS